MFAASSTNTPASCDSSTVRNEDDHCCFSNFKYELFIKAGTSHVRTGPKKKNRVPVKRI